MPELEAPDLTEKQECTWQDVSAITLLGTMPVSVESFSITINPLRAYAEPYGNPLPLPFRYIGRKVTCRVVYISPEERERLRAIMVEHRRVQLRALFIWLWFKQYGGISLN